MSDPTPTDSAKRRPRWPGILLGLYAFVAGGQALLSCHLWPEGWAVVTRPLMGAIGLTGGLLLLCGDPWWRPLLRFWALAQAAVIVVDPSGSLTHQPFLWDVGYSSVTTVIGGDQIRQMQGYGINVVALVLYGLTHWIIARKWYEDTPVVRWQFLALRVFRSLFVVVVVLVAGWLAWHWAAVLLTKNPLYVITSPLPGAEVFAGSRKLGSTPLVITQEKMVEWGLSKPEGAPRCQVARSILDEGLTLTGNKDSTLASFKPPWWCEGKFETFASENGPLALVINDLVGSNRCEILLMAKAQPGLTLSLPDGLPATAPAGGPVQLAVGLHRNPPDPRLMVSLQARPEQRAVLGVTFLMGSSTVTREVPLPEAWRDPAVGSMPPQSCKVNAPEKPGRYQVRVQYRLYRDAGNQRIDFGWARTYGVIEVK
jgi:hypothetical protein